MRYSSCHRDTSSSVTVDSPAIEQQVREALMSNTDSPLTSHLSSMPKIPYSLATPIDRPGSVHQPHVGLDKDMPIATCVVRPSSLDRLQAYLLLGERRQACHYALDQKMWAHAMLIASSLDKEMWKDVTTEFIRSELGATVGAELGRRSNGRESIRVAYSLFSGQGPASGLFASSDYYSSLTLRFLLVQEISPPKSLTKSIESLQPPLPSLMATPVSPGFPKTLPTSAVAPEVLAKWPEIAATIVSNSNSGDHASALSALGDFLAADGWIEAAHVWYDTILMVYVCDAADIPLVAIYWHLKAPH